jgi:hypothetical protein
MLSELEAMGTLADDVVGGALVEDTADVSTARLVAANVQLCDFVRLRGVWRDGRLAVVAELLEALNEAPSELESVRARTHERIDAAALTDLDQTLQALRLRAQPLIGRELDALGKMFATLNAPAHELERTRAVLDDASVFVEVRLRTAKDEVAFAQRALRLFGKKPPTPPPPPKPPTPEPEPEAEPEEQKQFRAALMMQRFMRARKIVGAFREMGLQKASEEQMREIARRANEAVQAMNLQNVELDVLERKIKVRDEWSNLGAERALMLRGVRIHAAGCCGACVSAPLLCSHPVFALPPEQLLFPIEFKGAGGTQKNLNEGGAARPAATFGDPARVEAILAEVARAVHLVNSMLLEEKLEPFSVLVGGMHSTERTFRRRTLSLCALLTLCGFRCARVPGHTSQTTAQSDAVSLSRAAAAAALLAEKLEELAPQEYAGTAATIRSDGEAGRPIEARAASGSFIRAKGFGASQRLPGYDDGKNYDQNRRVEVTLT